ncbi:hypothetical protein [Rhodoflexus sp.]
MNPLLQLNQLIYWIVLATGLAGIALPAAAQKLGTVSGKFIMLDRYGTKRIRLPEGSEIYFKLNGDKRKTRDYIGEIWEKDTAIYLVQSKQAVPLQDFESFYFPRNHISSLSGKAVFVGSGFLFAAAVADLIPNRFYDQRESAIIGGSFLVLSQSIKVFKWKRFKVKPSRSRARIINTSWE